MMKFLYPDIPWNTIKIVGFDVDGTLYDEFEFITQVYQPIAEKIASLSSNEMEEVKNVMLRKWLEKGSSYPFIFSETLVEMHVEENVQEELIEQALRIFRAFVPVISLSERMKWILTELKENYELFIVSDGSSQLQWNKIKSLKLENYVHKENIFISGDHGRDTEKPGLTSLRMLPVFSKEYHAQEVVFFGDRLKDKQYAKNAGFYFIDINERGLANNCV
ncbi:MAG TPA: HAD family hydrolase [Bacteroidia bacterium]|nr:HAD family hydrolase [Bacteroidia bacterium]